MRLCRPDSFAIFQYFHLETNVQLHSNINIRDHLFYFYHTRAWLTLCFSTSIWVLYELNIICWYNVAWPQRSFNVVRTLWFCFGIYTKMIYLIRLKNRDICNPGFDGVRHLIWCIFSNHFKSLIFMGQKSRCIYVRL